MENTTARIRNFLRLPKKEEILTAFSAFSRKEWTVFFLLCLAFVGSFFSILHFANKSVSVDVPRRGGSVREGIIGTPRFMNPILAFSDADKDIVSLVYSGLMRKTARGETVPDLAESYEVSPNGLEYTFVIRKDAYFHDGSPVTADDVVFTINEAKSPLIHTEASGNWTGIEAEKVNEKTVKFSLRSPVSSFLENASIGILPKKIWEGSPIELNGHNTDPVGSGPFEINKISREPDGIITSIDLSPFKKFTLGRPYLDDISLHFYSNETELLKALSGGKIDQAGQVAPESAKKLASEGLPVRSFPLPRIFGLFFNQSENQIFTDKNVVAAIDAMVDKERIVDEVLYGYGKAISGPIPENMRRESLEEKQPSFEERRREAEALLGKSGWKKNEEGFLEKSSAKDKKAAKIPLSFSISTSNSPDLAKAAGLIKEDLEMLGMQVEIKTYELGDLNQSVIRPRKYDALLFGEIVNRESDLYAFWHSSQRKDPGLNVAVYTNAKVDKILESALSASDSEEKAERYAAFEEEIRKDKPAVFLYSPSFIYVMKDGIKGFDENSITSSEERFSNAYLWYTEVDKVWKIFAKK